MADETQGQDNQTETQSAPDQTTQKQTTTEGKTETKTAADTQTENRDGKGRFAGKTTAAGGEQTATETKPVWPEDWRERMAATYGGEDAKAVAKELKRLQRLTDPSALYGSYRELDSKFSEGGLVKLPGKNAKPEDVAAFHKAMGVPEKPEAYLENLTLGDGKVLGDADKPIFEGFAKAAHAAGYTPAQTSAAVGWYLGLQEQQASDQYQADEVFMQESLAALTERWGDARKANISAIGSLFAEAPGGADPKNESSLMARILGGRTSDGRIIGDDPDITAWLSQMAREINPASTITPSTPGVTVASIDDEIADIESFMRTNRNDYFKDEAKQARYRELVTARDKIRAKAA